MHAEEEQDQMAQYAAYAASLPTHGHPVDAGRFNRFTPSEYVRRRAKAWPQFPPGSVAVIPAGIPKFMTQTGGIPIPHPSGYRPHPDFLWLTGCEDMGAVAVLESDAGAPGGVRMTVVAGPATAHDLVWDNAPESLGSVARRCGAEAVAVDLDGVLVEAKLRAGDRFRLFYDPDVNPGVHLQRGYFGPEYRHQVRSGVLESWVKDGMMWKAQVRCEDPTVPLGEARWVKGEAEVDAMRSAARATGTALIQTMRDTVAGETELAAGARFEYHARREGCGKFAYPACVGSGQRSAVVHCFPTGREGMREGDMLLMDVGGCVEGYASDITRTWAVPRARGGPARFSEAQALVYGAVLRTHEQLLRSCVEGTSFHALNAECVGLLGEELMALGWIDRPTHAEIKRFFPHNVSHPLGMDVHDGAKINTSQRVLTEGVVMTVEPGLYVPPWEREALRRQPHAKAVDFVGGIRIEDDVVIRARGAPEVLSDFVPRSMEDLCDLAAGTPSVQI